MHLAKGPEAKPILLPLLVCCVVVALEAVVLYQEDGDKALGTSFVAWGLEGRFFLQQEEGSRHLASKIQEIHPPHAQTLWFSNLPSTARQTTFTTLLLLPTEKTKLSNGRSISIFLPTTSMEPPAPGAPRAGQHHLELTASTSR